MRFGDRLANALLQLLESASAQVAKQHARRLMRKLRMLPLHLGKGGSRNPENIRQPVVVQVDNAVTPADEPRLDTQTGMDRDVIEIQMARVPVEGYGVFGKMSLQHVQQTVGVEIANGDAHASLLPAVRIDCQTRLQADLVEFAVAAVVKQLAGSRIARHVDLLPSVAVQVGR